MIKSKILIVFLPILILLLVVPASAQSRRWQVQPDNFLNLSEEQMAAIQEHQLAFQKDILSLRTTLMAGYMDLDNLYLQNAEQPKIESKIAELDQMELELDKQFEIHQQQISTLLTDEQRVLFDRFGGLGMGPGFGMGYGVGYGAGYGGGWARGAGRGAWGRGVAWSRSARDPRGYTPNMGYGRMPAGNMGRGMARAGAWNARGMGRGMGYFPRCWRWR
ncbi:MAG: hypothetical protein WBB73_05665 [Candidatus Aminicenantaceae bacterium]